MTDKKDFWDKLSSVTPLLIGILITGVGAIFTQIYNFQQLQLNQILALEKLRPLLVSDKPEDREFGYTSFAALGYEETAIRIIKVKKDLSGREVIIQLETSGSKKIQKETTKETEIYKNEVNQFGEEKVRIKDYEDEDLFE